MTSAGVVLAIDPQTPATLYAGTDDGVFKSTDAGASWTAASAGVTGFSWATLTIDPQAPSTLYFGTLNSLFKTIDGGANETTSYDYDPAASRDESRPVLTGILVQFTAGTLVMAATDSYRLAVKDMRHGMTGRLRPGSPRQGRGVVWDDVISALTVFGAAPMA